MPLAHILAPQIAQKVNQVEQDLGRAGYLQAGMNAPAGRQGAMKPAKPRPGESASAAALRELRAMPNKRPDQVFLDSAQAAYTQQNARDAGVPLGNGLVAKTQPIPNAPAPAAPAPAPAKKGKKGYLQFAPGEEIGTTESGKPIVAPPQSGPIVIQAPPAGQPFAANERGDAIDRKGKKVGYLKDPNFRTLERRPNDVALGDKDTYDRFGLAVLQNKFGKHLDAMQYDPAAGDMQFPPGYLDGMSKQEREEIKAGVARLQEINRGVSI